jgi:hypothetical protein
MIMSLYSHGNDMNKDGNDTKNMGNEKMMKMDDAEGNMKCGMNDGMMKMHNGNMMNGRYKKNMEIMTGNLDLNEDQAKIVSEKQYLYRMELIGLETEIKKAKLEKDKVTKQNDFKKIKKLNEKISSIEAQILNKKIELEEDIYNLLDEKQKEKWKTSNVETCTNKMMMHGNMNDQHK